MTQTIKRATDHHNVMAVIGKPKPTKEDRPKKKKSTKPRRAILEQQIEAMSKQIVFWRDGCECIEKDIDGVRCGGGVQWGHYIPRQQSRWLKYELGNTFCQCRNHNNLHDKGAQTMGVWFASTFGAEAALAMEAERNKHRGEKNKTTQELEDLLADMDELYQSRYITDLDIASLVDAGFFGDVIKRVWRDKNHSNKTLDNNVHCTLQSNL